MKAKSLSSMIAEAVEAYKDCDEQFTPAARKLGISGSKMRKLLTTAGMPPPVDNQLIAKALGFMRMGMSQDQAAREAGVSPKAMHPYRPYTKGPLTPWDETELVAKGKSPGQTRTKNAIAIKKHRDKIAKKTD